jgi:hypothetical protein
LGLRTPKKGTYAYIRPPPFQRGTPCRLRLAPPRATARFCPLGDQKNSLAAVYQGVQKTRSNTSHHLQIYGVIKFHHHHHLMALVTIYFHNHLNYFTLFYRAAPMSALVFIASASKVHRFFRDILLKKVPTIYKYSSYSTSFSFFWGLRCQSKRERAHGDPVDGMAGRYVSQGQKKHCGVFQLPL